MDDGRRCVGDAGGRHDGHDDGRSPAFNSVTAAPTALTQAVNNAAPSPEHVAAPPVNAIPALTAPGRTPTRSIHAPGTPSSLVEKAPADRTNAAPALKTMAIAPPPRPVRSPFARRTRRAARTKPPRPPTRPPRRSTGRPARFPRPIFAEGGGDGEYRCRALLDRAFDAALGGAALRAAGVAARAQDARGAIAQKVVIANTASPADAPSLYQDAIQTAKDALPAPAAAGIAKVVRSFAARKADVSLGDLAVAAFAAAAGGSSAETGHQLSAFDKWESLLGMPGRPLISNAAELKERGDRASEELSGRRRRIPRLTCGSRRRTARIRRCCPARASPRFPRSPRPSPSSPSGARARDRAGGDRLPPRSRPTRAPRPARAPSVYRARLLRSAQSGPGGLHGCRRRASWLRAALESLWKRIVAFFKGAASYELSQKSGQDALRRDAPLWPGPRAARPRRRAACCRTRA